MAANGRLSKISGTRSNQGLGGRRGSILVAVGSACLAAVLIYLYVSHTSSTSSKSVAAAPATSTVFVATRYIPPGTPASVIASEGVLKRESVSVNQVVAGAIFDPSVIANQTTTEGIAAGQQVTSVEFSSAAKVAIPSYLQGTYRGVAFSMNTYQGLTASLTADEYVDVMWLKGGSSELLASDVEVLSNSGGVVMLRLTDKQALELTDATQKGSLWLDYRPSHGAKQTVSVGEEETL